MESHGSGGGWLRKGKKGSGDKPRQPQRGLGVAQLEKIRIHSQMGYSYMPQLTNHKEDNVQMDPSFPSTALASHSTSSSSFYSNYLGQLGSGENEVFEGRHQDSPRAGLTSEPYAYPDYQRNLSNYGGAFMEHQSSLPSNITRNLLQQTNEDSVPKRRRGGSIGSSSRNSDSGDEREVDLDLKLSL
ncbi:hypothetical protein AMTRI_Chr05g66860 [Amborella trichopoda]